MRIALVALAALAGCDGARSVAFEDYAVEAADAFCAWAVTCRHVPDDATCRRLLDPKRYDTRRAADGIRLGRLGYDGEAAGRCLAAGRAADCPTAAFADPSCDAVFVGLVAPGGVCTGAFDCAGGGECVEPECDAGCCAGSCGPPPPPPPRRRAVGETCQAHGDCIDTAFCEIDGRCHEVPRNPGDHCLWGCWWGDLYCEGGTETCRVHAALGEACDDHLHRCNPNHSYCDGVCRSRPGPGEACDAEVRFCVPGTLCVEGRCRARGAPGDPCSIDDDCDVACDRAAGRCAAYQTCDPT
jgi:hypothetical protein